MTGLPIRVPEHGLTCDGQSLNVMPADYWISARLQELFDADGYDVVVSNVARSGISYTGLTSDVGQRATHGHRAQENGGLLIGGTSDIFWEADLGPKVYADAGAYAAALRARGYDWVMMTTITPTTSWFGSMTSRWAIANALINADASHYFDAVVDLASTPPLDDPGDTTYYSDGLHWSVAGVDAAAAILYPHLKTQMGL